MIGQCFSAMDLLIEGLDVPFTVADLSFFIGDSISQILFQTLQLFIVLKCCGVGGQFALKCFLHENCLFAAVFQFLDLVHLLYLNVIRLGVG